MNFEEELLNLNDVDIKHNKIILKSFMDVKGDDITSNLNSLVMRIVNIEKELLHIDSLDTSAINFIKEKIVLCRNTLVAISNEIAQIIAK